MNPSKTITNPGSFQIAPGQPGSSSGWRQPVESGPQERRLEGQGVERNHVPSPINGSYQRQENPGSFQEIIIPSSVVAAYAGNQHAVYHAPPNDQQSRHSLAPQQHQTDTHFTYEPHGPIAARSGQPEQSNIPVDQSHGTTRQWRMPPIPEQPSHRTSVPDLHRQPFQTQTAPSVTSEKPFAVSSTFPSPSTSSKPAHPVVIKNAATALAPIRHLYEKAWIQTVTNVQTEMSRMHTELLGIIEAERQQHAFTAQKQIATQEELNAANRHLKSVQNENEDLRAEVGRLKTEKFGLRGEVERAWRESELLQAGNQVMRKAQLDSAELKGDFDQLREEEGQKAAKDYMDGRLQAMKAEFEKQMEVQMGVLMKDLQEQKALRSSAERKLKEFKMMTERVFSSPENSTAELPSNADLRRTSEPATLIGTPEAEHIPRMKHEHEEPEVRLSNTTSIVFDQPRGSHAPSLPSSRVSSPIPRSTPQFSQHASTRQSSSQSRNSSPLPLPPLRTSSLTKHLVEHNGSHLPESYHPRPSSSIPSQSRSNSRTTSRAPSLSISIPPPSSLDEGIPAPHSSKRSRPPSPHPPSSPRRPSFMSPLSRPPDQSAHSQLQRSATTPSAVTERHFHHPLQEAVRKRGRSEFEQGDEGAPVSWSDVRRVRHHTTPRSTPTPTQSFTDPGGTRLPPAARVKREEGEVDDDGMRDSGWNTASAVRREKTEEGEIRDGVDSRGERKRKTSTTHTHARAPLRNKIGINHMDLLYETRGDMMLCRMCRTPAIGEQASPTPATFPTKATWAELVGHCQTIHPKSCEDLERLSPSQVAELRQRMMSSKVAGFRSS